MKKTIKVKAKPGLMVHFPQGIVVSPGRKTRVLQGEEVIEIPNNTRFVRRRLLMGDLIEVGADVVESSTKPTPKPAPKPKSEPKED